TCQECRDGECVDICDKGVCCGGKCLDCSECEPLNRAFCTCESACPEGAQCCNGICIERCADCHVCSGGQCVDNCPPGNTCCGMSCVNCGACEKCDPQRGMSVSNC